MPSIVARGPLAEFDAVRREMNGLMRSFDRALQTPAGDGGPAVPPLNFYEAEDAVLVTAELPGLEAGHVEVSVRADELTVSGSWPVADAPENGHWLRRERPRGEFRRTVRLPFVPPADGVSAEFARGVLTLELKKPEETRPRRIDVKAA